MLKACFSSIPQKRTREGRRQLFLFKFLVFTHQLVSSTIQTIACKFCPTHPLNVLKSFFHKLDYRHTYPFQGHPQAHEQQVLFQLQHQDQLMKSTNLRQNQKLSNHILLGWKHSTKCEHKNCQTP